MTRSGPPGTELEIVDDEFDEVVPPEAEGLAVSLLLVPVVVLIGLAPLATRSQPADKAWFLAPINWPLLGLGVAFVAGASIALRFLSAYRAAPDKTAFRANAFWAFGGMGRAFEYSGYFCAYLVVVANLGFTIATVLFLQGIFWRSGLRGTKWVLCALILAVATVLIFRVGMGLWFPFPPVLDLLPASVGNSLGAYL
jgi:hypothetical protein